MREPYRAVVVEFVGDGDEHAFPARGDVTDGCVQERVLLVAVGTDRVHVPVSRWASTRRMNLSQPSAARIRRARLGAPGRGSGGVSVWSSAMTGGLRGGSDVVTLLLLSARNRQKGS